MIRCTMVQSGAYTLVYVYVPVEHSQCAGPYSPYGYACNLYMHA